MKINESEWRCMEENESKWRKMRVEEGKWKRKEESKGSERKHVRNRSLQVVMGNEREVFQTYKVEKRTFGTPCIFLVSKSQGIWGMSADGLVTD